MLRPRSNGIEIPRLKKLTLAEQIAQQNLQPNPTDKEGNFRWYFGFQQRSEGKSPIPATQKKQKLQFLADMGLLPDNDILSNKLINIYGKRIFDLIHDKSRAVEVNKGFRKKVGLALNITHETFSSNTRIDLHVCWMMVQKIRAIQRIDTLLNTTSTDFQQNYLGILKRVQTEIDTLLQLIPTKTPETESYIKTIYAAEIAEIEALKQSVESLSQQLNLLKTQDQYQRNQVLQTWQCATFRQFNLDFKIHEGHIGLAGMLIPLAKENISNSIVRTEAEYILQKHRYSEWQPITPKQLWLIDDENCGKMLTSDPYCKNNRQRKELLLGACISEQLAEKGETDGFKHIDLIQEKDLTIARNEYQTRKAELQQNSLTVKANDHSSVFLPVKNFLAPEKIDAETGLPLTSREFSRYLRSIKIQFGGRKKLDHSVQVAIQSLSKTITATKEDTSRKSITTEITLPSAPAEFSTLNLQHAPLPNPVKLVNEDDGLAPTLDFIETFLLFFDKDLAAKRPYITLFFFTLPCAQIALPILAGGSSSSLFAKMASIIFTAEANLAKYTGLNLFLKTIINQELTAANLAQATNAVRDAMNWFTCADSTLEQVLVATLVAKISFNIGDLLLNTPFLDHDAALLSEYLTVLFPDTSGSLESYRKKEKLKNFCVGFLYALTQLGLAAFTVGGLEHFIPGMEILLSPLANVPWDKITTPNFSSMEVLQTLGVSKAAALILLKTYGILEGINSGQLIDIDGYKLRKDSDSFKILTLFLQLAHCSSTHREKLLKNMDPRIYDVARHHFEELLSHNRGLIELYAHNGSYENLNELKIKIIAPKARHKYPMAFLKTVPVLLKLTLGLIPGIFITLLFLIASAIAKTSPYALLPDRLKPIYRYGVESLNLFVKLGKIAWTFGKVALHPFALVGVRALEIGLSIVTLPFFLGATTLRLFSWGGKKLFNLKHDPVHRFMVKPILKMHAIVAGWLRENLRYPLERNVGSILRGCRDIFVRKIEREIQVGATVESSTSSCSSSASVGADPCVCPAGSAIKSGQTQKPAPTETDRPLDGIVVESPAGESTFDIFKALKALIPQNVVTTEPPVPTKAATRPHSYSYAVTNKKNIGAQCSSTAPLRRKAY